MSKKNQDTAYFLSFCIEQWKTKRGISGAETSQELPDRGMLKDGVVNENEKETIRSMTNLNITQDNLHLLLPSKVMWLAGYLAEDTGMSIVEATKRIYASDLYKRLEQESSKLWQMGHVALYEETC